MSSKKQITVINATGNIGRTVVNNLAKPGYDVNAILGSPGVALKVYAQKLNNEV